MVAFRRDNGRFDYSDLERACRCGHQLADHSATGDRRCFVGQNTHEDGPVCPCTRFTPARRRVARRKTRLSFHGVMVSGARMAKDTTRAARINAYVAERACR